MCNEYKFVDTIGYYLFSCQLVKTIWSEIEQWWLDQSSYPLVLTDKHVRFKLQNDISHFSAINYLMLLRQMSI